LQTTKASEALAMRSFFGGSKPRRISAVPLSVMTRLSRPLDSIRLARLSSPRTLRRPRARPWVRTICIDTQRLPHSRTAYRRSFRTRRPREGHSRSAWTHRRLLLSTRSVTAWRASHRHAAERWQTG
jgi:hypothetical protein